MKWLREPLVHFLALGAGLFLLFSLVGGVEEDSSDQIVVSAAQIEIMAEGFARTWQRPPIAQEVTGLIDDYIRDEIYYREALAMGLDRDDTIIRRRLRQKMEFFTDDLQAAVVPEEEQLRVYLDANPEKFRVPARVSFEHIYLNADQRGAQASSDAESLLARLQEGDPDLDLSALGDPLPLPREYVNAPADRVGSRFGGGFAERLVESPVGTWSGPIESGFGLHLVLVTERRDGEVPAYEDIEDIIEREWRAEQRNTVKEAFYQTLRQRYSVVVEEPTFGDGEPGEADAGEESR
jgi:hypothetical protein